MGAFGVVELEGAAERVEDFFRGAREPAAFQADVVVDADTGEQGDFLAAQSGDPSLAVPEGGQAGLLSRLRR